MKRYIIGSFIFGMALVGHAMLTKEQFFPAMVHLSSSKLSMAVLGNMGFVSMLATYKILTKIFLGSLRDYEIERVNDRVGQAIIETLLAMTIFRQEFTLMLVSQFALLGFIKILHWLGQDRVDFIETTPNVPLVQHIRLGALLVFLTALDMQLLHFFLTRTMKFGVSIHLLFAFEYIVQISAALSTLMKYGISLFDLSMGGSWAGKSVAVFYVELSKDLAHLVAYLGFFLAVFSTYGIPIHLIREIYWTVRNFQTRVRDFLRYRQISVNMENRFPDATEEELERADHVCIVCREEMSVGLRAKRLPCGHVFHMDCLKSWLERQQNCPICRAEVTAANEGRNSVPQEQQAMPPPDQAQVQQQREEQVPGVDENVNAEEETHEHEDPITRLSPPNEEFLRRLEARMVGDGHEEAKQAAEGQAAEGQAAEGQAAEGQAAGSSLGDRNSKGKAPVDDAGPSSGLSQNEDASAPLPPEEYQCIPILQPHWVPTTSMAMFVSNSEFQPLQYPAQDVPTSSDVSNQRIASVVPAIPIMVPVSHVEAAPSLQNVDHEKLKAIARDLGIDPSTEQHERAIAVAAAAAQAAMTACTSYVPVVSAFQHPEVDTNKSSSSAS